MQDNKQNNQSPDDDILQSKADLRELLKAAGQPETNMTPRRVSHEGPSSPDASGAKSDTSEIILDAEFADAPVPPAGSSSNPNGADKPDITPPAQPGTESNRSNPLERLPADKQSHNQPVIHLFHAEQDPEMTQDPPTISDIKAFVEKLQQAHQKAEKELWEKTRLLEHQQQRTIFLEQHLHNAVVLERAKSQYQQEAEKLRLENQQFTAEIAQLKSRLEDLYGTDAQVQRLRNELEIATSAQSEQQTLAAQMKETMQVLQNELAAYKQQAHESKTRQKQYEQQVADINADYQRLRENHERIINERAGESAAAIRQTEAQLEKSAAQTEELRNRYHQLQGDFDQIRHEYEAFQAQANEEIRMLTESTDVLTDENARLSDEIHQVDAQKQQLQQMLKNQQAREQETPPLREQIQQERQISDDLRQRLELLQAELSQVRGEKDELVEQLHAMQSTEAHLQQEIEQLRDAAADVEVLQEKLDESQNEVQRLCEEHQSLQNQLDELQAGRTEPEPVCSAFESAEQPLDEGERDEKIPVFNLADQIMEAHRRSVAGRRQRVKPAPAAHHSHSIKDVIGHYIPSSERPVPSENTQTAPSHYPWADPSLTPFQREILREIVRRDMKLAGTAGYAMADYSSMHN